MRASRPQGPTLRPTWAILATLGMALAGCSTFSLNGRPDFNAGLAAGYTATAQARQSGLTLLQARQISLETAASVQGKADQLRGALDLAASVHATDPGAGSGLLVRVTSAIGQLARCASLEAPRIQDCATNVEVPQR